MTEIKYDPENVTIEINGEVLTTNPSTLESIKEMDIYSTKTLQLNSLYEYARSLGYVPRDPEMLSKGFELVKPCGDQSTHLSFNDACRLHNLSPSILTDVIRYVAGLNNMKLHIPTMSLQFAGHKKLVHCVKLQRDGKQPDGVKCQSNMVKLTDTGKTYCAQFPRYDFLLCED